MAFAFSATLAMNRAFVREQEAGALEGLLVSPVSRDAIFLAKAATSFLFMLLIEAVLLPAYSVMLGFSALSWTLGVTILLATLGFALIGTLFSALAAQTRSREIMLPVLFFPIVLPVIPRCRRGHDPRHWGRHLCRHWTMAASYRHFRRMCFW